MPVCCARKYLGHQVACKALFTRLAKANQVELHSMVGILSSNEPSYELTRSLHHNSMSRTLPYVKALRRLRSDRAA